MCRQFLMDLVFIKYFFAFNAGAEWQKSSLSPNVLMLKYGSGMLELMLGSNYVLAPSKLMSGNSFEGLCMSLFDLFIDVATRLVSSYLFIGVATFYVPGQICGSSQLNWPWQAQPAQVWHATWLKEVRLSAAEQVFGIPNQDLIGMSPVATQSLVNEAAAHSWNVPRIEN